MTEQQRPKEYIITEMGMNLAIAVLKSNHLYDTAEFVLREIRPHPAPASEYGCEPEKKYGIPTSPASENCRACRAEKCCVIWDCLLRSAIARAAREKVLTDILRIARSETMHDGIHAGWLMYDSFRQEIESLRGEQEGDSV